MRRGDFILAVCAECVQVTANGTDGMDLTDDRTAQITAGTDEMSDEGFHLIAVGEELGFSHSPCDLCSQAHAAGDRFTVLATYRKPQ